MENLAVNAVSFADRLSGPALKLVAALNIAFAALLLLTIISASARAQDAGLPACTGVNLLQELADTDPEAHRAVLAEGAETLNGDAILFRIQKNGVAPSYLFGTMHMTDPRVTELPAFAQDAFDASDVLVIETTEILDPAKSQMALLTRPELTMFTTDERISDFLDAGDEAVLREGLASRGLQLALVDRMKPWLVAAMVALPECEMARKQAGQPILDIALAERAEAAGKELVGLETIVEQLEAMASLPMAFHVRGLVETIALGDRIDDVIETMIALYGDGQTGLVWPVLRVFTPEAVSDEGGYAAFEQTMVTARNHTMAKRSLPILETGGAFIAVGALHLPGEEGLAKLFEDAGYTVTPVYE
ncbi:polysaccharide biosynthesis protein GumN [Oceaniradius stylonematis]|uniref:Polysaccharide biosynthesis protein GumN n=1 Tax=Oceaniradius stylonematis TaxID=2184161 RepID=A0A3A8AAN9_9HYPH|nr:TraB/GumN family protein [Oceaniradius stylonematis]RKF07367.1 polysaccharide biosynthesis protein GumN [Oceaniradius stylonematis]